jgi:hypothetical protein
VYRGQTQTDLILEVTDDDEMGSEGLGEKMSPQQKRRSATILA